VRFFFYILINVGTLISFNQLFSALIIGMFCEQVKCVKFKTVILNCNNISQYCFFYCIFGQTNFLSKTYSKKKKKILPTPKSMNGSTVYLELFIVLSKLANGFLFS